MAYSRGDTERNEASQMATIMNFAISKVTFFLRENVTRQNRSNAMAVSVKMEQETVESEIKLAVLQTMIPCIPGRQTSDTFLLYAWLIFPACCKRSPVYPRRLSL